MLQQLWADTLQIGELMVPTALGVAAMSLALARVHLETIEAIMLAAVLLLIALVI